MRAASRASQPFRTLTIRNATTTISVQASHLDTLTTRQPACWSGYTQAPRNVATFSARNTNSPIKANASSSGSRTVWSETRNTTQVRRKARIRPAMTAQRRSGP